MDISEVAKLLAETIQREGSVRAVFGDPVELEGHTIVPVATVEIGMGGGGATATSPTARAAKAAVEAVAGGTGGGGGLSVKAIPIGFLHVEDGHVVFSSLTDSHGGAISKILERVQSLRAQTHPTG